MLMLTVKQQASNNLIMRLEMPGGRGADAILLPPAHHRQLAEPVSCQPVSCLSPCFSLAPRCAAVRADGAGPTSACRRRAGGMLRSTGSCTLPHHTPSVPAAGQRWSPWGWWGHGWSTSYFPGCRWVAVLTSCLVKLTPLHPSVQSRSRKVQWSFQGQVAQGAQAASPSAGQQCPRTRGHPSAVPSTPRFGCPKVLSTTNHLRDQRSSWAVPKCCHVQDSFPARAR